MLHIDEDKLKVLLLNKKNRIEIPKYSGIGEIISSISIIITLCLSDYSQISIIKPLYFKIIAWLIAVGILIYGTNMLRKSIFNFYSIDKLYSEIADLDSKAEHPFDIILIKNKQKSGEYLLFKSKRWNCWLFPNYHCSNKLFNKTEEIIYIKKCIKRDLNISKNVNINYIGNQISSKYSVFDKIYKKYNFHYFTIQYENFDFDRKRKFKFNGKNYCWKTLDKMYSSKNIVKKNKDVLDYVRRKCDIS